MCTCRCQHREQGGWGQAGGRLGEGRLGEGRLGEGRLGAGRLKGGWAGLGKGELGEARQGEFSEKKRGEVTGGSAAVTSPGSPGSSLLSICCRREEGAGLVTPEDSSSVFPFSSGPVGGRRPRPWARRAWVGSTCYTSSGFSKTMKNKPTRLGLSGTGMARPWWQLCSHPSRGLAGMRLPELKERVSELPEHVTEEAGQSGYISGG